MMMIGLKIVLFPTDLEVLKMGYYTKYKLSIEEGMVTTRITCKACNGEGEIISKIVDSLSKRFEIDNESTAKWYEHEDEMIEVSKQFPDTIFKLQGEGEERIDVWEKFFKDGKMIKKNKTRLILEEDDE